MVRQARQMVAEGQLGRIRVIRAEYVQDWLATRLEATGQKQAAWRTDRGRAPGAERAILCSLVGGNKGNHDSRQGRNLYGSSPTLLGLRPRVGTEHNADCGPILSLVSCRSRVRSADALYFRLNNSNRTR